MTPAAPVASATVDKKKGSIFDVHAMDDDDEPRLVRPITTQAGTKSPRAERTVACCMELLARLPETSCVSDQGKECAGKHA